MKARLIRFAFGLHRWMGVVLGLLMLLWCLSGFVMIYSPYPAITGNGRDFRREGLAPIVLPAAVQLPSLDAVPEAAKVTSARVEMLADAPVLRLGWTKGGGAFDLSTGQPIAGMDEAAALGVARTYAARHHIAGSPSVKKLSERDEFMVAGYFNSQRPFWQVRLNDPARTMLYISARSGEVRQITTASNRFWSWLGAIPHWLYFTELRKDTGLWTQVVIWTSLGGCFLTVLGLFAGLRQLRRRKSTGKLASPYRGAKSWHHWIGLSFGVLVLTWTFSGFTSMQPWGWLETGSAAGEAASRYSDGARPWPETRADLQASIEALRAMPGETVQLVSAPSQNTLWFLRFTADGARTRLAPDGRPAPFDQEGWRRAGAILAGAQARPKVELIEKGDAFYYKGASASALPVVRITVPEMQDTRFYLDATSGQVLATADPGDRGFRWWHMALHRLDFASGLARQILVMVLLAGVSTVCGLGAWLGIRKIARGGRLDGAPKG